MSSFKYVWYRLDGVPSFVIWVFIINDQFEPANFYMGYRLIEADLTVFYDQAIS